MAAPHIQSKLPRAAEPLLASALLSPSALESILDSLTLNATPASAEPLKPNIPSLDAALAETFQSGNLVALSGENSTARDLVARTLLVDCLVRHTASTVAVVDTLGNFDVVALYKGVVRRLESELGGAEGMGMGESGVQGVAAKMLDRVEIMRVFDFVGMREAVGELREGLEGGVGRRVCGGARGEMATAAKSAVAAEVVVEKDPSPQRKRTEVADSEDEDDGLEDSDDEMLFETQAPATRPAQSPPSPPAADTIRPPTTGSTPDLPLKLILIDNLSHVLTPLLKQDTISANTLATTFLTTLSDLTRTHALHTILLNPCTTPHVSPPPRKAADMADPAPQQAYKPQPPPPPSIFSSNAAVPALLGLMSRYADAHVLVSMLPRRKMDARVYYADAGVRERGKRKDVEMVGVVEVVADRWGGRVGAWGAFKEGRDGGIDGL